MSNLASVQRTCAKRQAQPFEVFNLTRQHMITELFSSKDMRPCHAIHATSNIKHTSRGRPALPVSSAPHISSHLLGALAS